MKEDTEDRKLDALIDKGFKNMEPPRIPDSFADSLTQKFELRTLKRRLWEEWVLKMIVIIGIAACSIVVLQLTQNNILSYFKFEYALPLLGLPIIIFVFFFDQVLLKWMFILRSHKTKQLS